MKRFIHITTNAILIVLAIIAILLVFSMLPIKNNYKVLTVTSGSMSPTIPRGSLVIVKPSETYAVNDIVALVHQMLTQRLYYSQDNRCR